MGFYEEISKYYDYIFPVNQTQLKFFENQFKSSNAVSVLDIACGSGNYTVEFAKWGLQVVGVDLEKEMVEKAINKNNAIPNLAFKIGNMLDLPFADSSFDSCLCIGNSLPHLLKEQELSQAVREMGRILKPEGQATIQVVNYDRILDKKITELPLIEHKEQGITFIRKYSFRKDGLIDFNTELDVLKEGFSESFRNSIILKPLKRADIEELLLQAGFATLQFYGGFDRQELSKESPATIVIASKG